MLPHSRLHRVKLRLLIRRQYRPNPRLHALVQRHHLRPPILRRQRSIRPNRFHLRMRLRENLPHLRRLAVTQIQPLLHLLRSAAPDPCAAVPASDRSAVVPAAVDPAAVEAPSPVGLPPRSNLARHHTARPLLHETSCSLQTSSSPIPCSLQHRRKLTLRRCHSIQTLLFAKCSAPDFEILSLKLSPSASVFRQRHHLTFVLG